VAGVPVVLVTKEGARWENEHGEMSATFPGTDLIDQIEPRAARDAFLTKAVSHNNEYYSSFAQTLTKRVKAAVDANKERPAELALERRGKLLKARDAEERAGAVKQPAEKAAHAPHAPHAPHAAPATPSRGASFSEAAHPSVTTPTRAPSKLPASSPPTRAHRMAAAARAVESVGTRWWR